MKSFWQKWKELQNVLLIEEEENKRKWVSDGNLYQEFVIGKYEFLGEAFTLKAVRDTEFRFFVTVGEDFNYLKFNSQ